MSTNTLDSKKHGLSNLAGNIFYTLGRQLFSSLIGLALVVILARLLGPEGNGGYAIILLLPMMLSTFLNLGIGPANVYFIGRGDFSIRTVFRGSLRIWFVLVCVGFLAAAGVINYKAEQWFPGMPESLLWLSLLAFPFSYC